MTAWTGEELNRVGHAEELEVASRRRDGTMRHPVTVWAVRHADDIYVRSAVRGRNAAWFRGVKETHRGRIRAAGLEKDVTFEDAQNDVNDEVDAAYRLKYRRYSGRILDSVLTPEARSTTMRLTPR